MRPPGVGLLLLAVAAVFGACADAGGPAAGERAPVLADSFPDVLDLAGAPDSALDASAWAFSDLGAWHMFGLPDPAAGEALGGFAGPLLLTDGGLWMGPSLATLSVWAGGADEPLPWEPGGVAAVASYPGRLSQRLTAGEVEARLDRVFVSERSALIRAAVTNVGSRPARWSVGWSGDARFAPARAMTLRDGAPGILVQPEASPTVVEVRAARGGAGDAAPVPVAGPTAAYTLRTPAETVPAGAGLTHWILVSAYESRAALDADRARRDAVLAAPDSAMAAQAERWNGYLAGALGRLAPGAPPEHRRIAVKAVQTLSSNWRSPLGALRHDGLFPSYAYRGFHGVWSWDSWKHARALALFAPELAKEQVRVLLVRQDTSGMIPDVIYADSTEDNWRDTKPPLAAWAVAGILDATGDTAFVREVFPALAAYHAWWYTHRDHDGDGLCEYGSTDGTRIAAAWESGMDNAVRFDSAAMVRNGPGAWSLDQESVDLNAYLFAEKGYLAFLADALGQSGEADAYRREAEALGRRIRDVMWDADTGWFHDVRMDTGEPIRVMGPEGWIPLWAGVATPEQARRVAAAMLDPARVFATVPLPTLSMDRPEFDPADGYWRGPVWLDQAYFGVRGLERYGLTEAAARIRSRLLVAPQGLAGGAPIFENYDPRTGAGLNAPHFSWSAAHLLMLLDAEDAKRP
ncbi:MAG: glycoside hydrolase [Gemmatimonadetes bacterium]|nr:glycoside hydrolase [Gemmatimonadota bacterium]